ncbi:PP2C family protein-serine/threonine phosphatase [Streptomyces leeuwenhoekii]|uniref:PP2C family protein-serine/threonine phosphatase n=1 Tax=Streptomyces leeuwenhoekii TaxID=1437453 RepID=UPI0036923C64
MIRIRAGVPRRTGRSRTNHPAPAPRTGPGDLRQAVRRALQRAARQAGGPPLRRVRGLGLPAAWGAVAVTYRLTCPLAHHEGLGARLAGSAVLFAVGTGILLHARRTLLRELREARRIAGAAQGVLLRPLPERIDGLSVAAAQLSADPGAEIGGDLYEAVPTEHGVRVVMGDVRGHGIAALGTVAAVLGSFREAAYDEPDLERLLRRLDRALARHLRDRARTAHAAARPVPPHPVAEEFVTLLLLEIGPDGEIRALNCGHPWPYRVAGTRVEPLARADPLPPLGMFPLPAELPAVPCGHLLPGEALFLHTDGAEDARDAEGRFFSLPDVLAHAVREPPLAPRALLATVLTALLRHAHGAPSDDVALLMLRNDRAPSAPRDGGPCDTAPRAGHPTPCAQPTNQLR